MLGYLIADSLQRWFAELTLLLPVFWQILVFTLLNAAFLLASTALVMWGCLHVDAHLAVRGRLGQGRPDLLAYVLGAVGLIQAALMVTLLVALIISTFFFAMTRAGVLSPQSHLATTFRAVHLCLVPSSGRGDSLRRCPLFH